jgi:hypothetical protein
MCGGAVRGRQELRGGEGERREREEERVRREKKILSF